MIRKNRDITLNHDSNDDDDNSDNNDDNDGDNDDDGDNTRPQKQEMRIIHPRSVLGVWEHEPRPVYSLANNHFLGHESNVRCTDLL
jgi:hypothetical protein